MCAVASQIPEFKITQRKPLMGGAGLKSEDENIDKSIPYPLSSFTLCRQGRYLEHQRHIFKLWHSESVVADCNLHCVWNDANAFVDKSSKFGV